MAAKYIVKRTAIIINKNILSLCSLRSLRPRNKKDVCSTAIFRFSERPRVASAFAATIRRNIRDLYSVSTSIGTFQPNISGSVPSMDSALDYDVNKFEISVTEPVALNRFVAQIQPSSDGEKLGGITLENVEGSTSHKIGVIKASSPFLITGRNISGSMTGEGVEILAMDGGIASACTVDSTVRNGQIVKASFTTALEPGVYQVRLSTKGFHNPLETAISLTKKVQVSD